MLRITQKDIDKAFAEIEAEIVATRKALDYVPTPTPASDTRKPKGQRAHSTNKCGPRTTAGRR